MASTSDRPQQLDPLEFPSLYGYVPTRWITILFVVLFSLTTLLHIGQAAQKRIWWLFPTAVLCGVAEVLGWCGRLWSSYNPRGLNPYLMQICSTILAPSFLTAGVFNILGIIIRRVGPQYSLLPPKWYLIIFISLDLAALIVQAVGGANASLAVENHRDPEPGGKTMMWGIIVQLIGIVLFTILAADFLLRFFWNKPIKRAIPDAGEKEVEVKTKERRIETRLVLMLVGAGITTLFVIIRSVYRTIELADGWTGRIITTQVYFNILDGAAIVLAMVSLNIFHPGRLLGDSAITLGRKPSPAKLSDPEAAQEEKLDSETAEVTVVEER